MDFYLIVRQDASLLLLTFPIFIFFERLYFLKSEGEYQKARNFLSLKSSAKSLCGLLKESYTVSKFVITKTIHITKRQGKTFYL